MTGIDGAAFGDVVAIAVVFHESRGGLHLAGRGIGVVVIIFMRKISFNKATFLIKKILASLDGGKAVLVVFAALVVVRIGTGLLPAGLALLGCSLSRNHGQRKNKKHRQNCDSDIDFPRVFLNHNAFVIALS